MEGSIRTGRFRTRLILAFLLVAAASAGTIGMGAYLLVYDSRYDDFVARSLRDAEANYLSFRDATPADRDALSSLVARLERRAADATVITNGEETYSSVPTITRDDLPEDLTPPRIYESGTRLPHEDVTIDGTNYLVVVTPESSSGDAMHFFYSKSGFEAGLNELAGITWRLWLVVVVGAALVGNALARRTLRPVSQASEAARSLAEGLLDTRLPVESEDEFGAWANSFNEMAEALERMISDLVEARDRELRFTSDVSHELRTPLTALMTSASMLEERLEDSGTKARWASERMIREARRLRVLVEELLEVSRLHSGQETLRIDVVDLGRLVDSSVASHGWEGTVEVDSHEAVVSTDKARVERIVTNLISNSVEHGKVSPRVAVGVNGGRAFVQVRDDGRGIDRDHIPHLFERFYKADPSRAGGSGLGLSIAAENARLVGGEIEVSSEPGKGAIFTLWLPVVLPAPN